MSYTIQPLSDDIRVRAIAQLQGVLAPRVFEEVRELYVKNPERWWAIHHMFFGMTIRNILRGAIKDDELPDNGIGPNWDDYYIEVLEEAAGIDRDR